MIKRDFINTELVERTTYETADSIHPGEYFMLPVLKESFDVYLFDYLAKKLQGRFSEIRVLDVGCGGQPLRKKLEAMGCRYYEMDVIQQNNFSLDFLCAIDKPLPEVLLQSEKFELVICTEVLEHVADWNQAFSNISTLLIPGGYLFVTAPHIYILHEEPYDYWRPTLYAIEYFSRVHKMEPVMQMKAGRGRDVLGMVLGSFYFDCGKTSLKNSMLIYLAKFFKWGLYKILKNPGYKDIVVTNSAFYISNIVIVQKDG